MPHFLFITFSPKLLSGPIVRSKEMMPQISENHKLGLTWADVAGLRERMNLAPGDYLVFGNDEF